MNGVGVCLLQVTFGMRQIDERESVSRSFSRMPPRRGVWRVEETFTESARIGLHGDAEALVRSDQVKRA